MNRTKDFLPETWTDKLDSYKVGTERIYAIADESDFYNAFMAVVKRNRLGKDLFLMTVGKKSFTIKCCERNNEYGCMILKKKLSLTMDLSKKGVPTNDMQKIFITNEERLKAFLFEDNCYMQLFQFWYKNAQSTFSKKEIDKMLKPLLDAVLNILGLTLKI